MNPVAIAALDRGWHREWKALGFKVIPWGWVEGDPAAEAALAVGLAKKYGLDGYIANAEDPYEGPANYWKSAAFTTAFRALAPGLPLGLSYIGFGNPHRDFVFKPWVDAQAALLPQSYWATEATSIYPSLWAASNVPLPADRIVPTLGASAFAIPYSPAKYVEELKATGTRGFSVWLLDSTNDDYLRALSPATGG